MRAFGLRMRNRDAQGPMQGAAERGRASHAKTQAHDARKTDGRRGPRSRLSASGPP